MNRTLKGLYNFSEQCRMYVPSVITNVADPHHVNSKIIAISTCFIRKTNIWTNKPSRISQKNVCTLTNLYTVDEVTRIDGTF
jgi:hypothetical protein